MLVSFILCFKEIICSPFIEEHLATTQIFLLLFLCRIFMFGYLTSDVSLRERVDFSILRYIQIYVIVNINVSFNSCRFKDLCLVVNFVNNSCLNSLFYLVPFHLKSQESHSVSKAMFSNLIFAERQRLFLPLCESKQILLFFPFLQRFRTCEQILANNSFTIEVT